LFLVDATFRGEFQCAPDHRDAKLLFESNFRMRVSENERRPIRYSQPKKPAQHRADSSNGNIGNEIKHFCTNQVQDLILFRKFVRSSPQDHGVALERKFTHP
jgi:hypothetical protein